MWVFYSQYRRILRRKRQDLQWSSIRLSAILIIRWRDADMHQILFCTSSVPADFAFICPRCLRTSTDKPSSNVPRSRESIKRPSGRQVEGWLSASFPALQEKNSKMLFFAGIAVALAATIVKAFPLVQPSHLAFMSISWTLVIYRTSVRGPCTFAQISTLPDRAIVFTSRLELAMTDSGYGGAISSIGPDSGISCNLYP